MSRDVELDHVTMRFGDFTAVNDVSLHIKAGEFFSFLGPSGCGKTTILRMISGFMDPTGGAIRIGGQDMRGIGPNKRPTALIFQNLALFPMMSVADNIAFGLEMRGVDKAARRKRAEELLDLIALPGSGDKRIDELSGGQKQRVAIARALAVEPQVMLLDEPLSALDLKLRQHMRAELRAIQRRTGLTFIYITHDQGEALTMSDRVAVMSRGRIEQVGPSASIYDAPETPFVATFVGENNVFRGKVTAAADGLARVETPAGVLLGRNARGMSVGSDALIFVRPERMRLDPADAGDNRVTRPVAHLDFEGSFANLVLSAPEGSPRPILVQLANDGRLGSLQPGAERTVGFAPADGLVLPAGELAKD
ncbi:ABC transporter ATP-binding protein [Chthonobacter albigriseus]|uniref:ABC transporter ATP-binding protein n=1 Tax=Chthonobacter albigriseus TaxID=1683161 RepID=UPI0015EF4057|nr:ABC transporter ATP-binding protein [Chthonobacter albigriseus]